MNTRLIETLRNLGSQTHRLGCPTCDTIHEAANEIERLEKERFKYETALMLIGQGYSGSVGLAKAAVTKSERV